MKKILFALLTLFCINTLSAANSVSASEEGGKRYLVTIKVNVYYEYYKDKYKNGPLGTEYASEPIEQQVWVYAKTEDEAESKAKNQCSQMCRTYGTYQGTCNYKGQTAHEFMYRQIASARAVLR